MKPVWAIDSNDMGTAIIFLMVIMIIPVYPLGYFGYMFGDYLAGINIVRWVFAIVFMLIGYGVIIGLNDAKGIWYSVFFIAGEWFVFDMYNSFITGKEIWVISFWHTFYTWALAS